MSILDTKKILGYAQSYARTLLRRHEEDTAAHAGVIATHDADLTAHGLEDTNWILVTLQSGWGHYGVPFEFVSYRRKNGIVYIQGFMNGLGTKTAETLLWTLPAGFRPSADKHQPVLIDTSTGNSRIKIQANGEVRVNAFPGAMAWVSFAGISFPADN